MANLNWIEALKAGVVPDGVYVDSVNGVAGTTWPIGTPGMPVDNLTDALAIMAARKLQKMYLESDITFDTNIDLILIGNPKYTITISAGVTANFNGDLICKSLVNTTGTINVKGNLTLAIGDLSNTTGIIQIYGNAYINGSILQTNSGSVNIYGDCQVGTNITNSSGGEITVEGKLDCIGSLNNTGGDDLSILDNCHIHGNLTNTTNNIYIFADLLVDGTFNNSSDGYVGVYGDCWIAGNITNSTGGWFEIYGNGYFSGSITNTGTLIYRNAGKTATFTKNITSAANAGDVTVATIKNGTCLIKSVILRSNGATTANLTSAGIFGGASKVITFLSATDAVKANIDAADKQVSWYGAVTLKTDKTIVISLVGTGSATVDLDVDIEYEAITSGAYLA
jgi:hypothetical protein